MQHRQGLFSIEKCISRSSWISQNPPIGPKNIVLAHKKAVAMPKQFVAMMLRADSASAMRQDAFHRLMPPFDKPFTLVGTHPRLEDFGASVKHLQIAL